MVKRKKKSKKRKKSKADPKEPKRTKLDVLKEQVNDLALNISEDLEVIKRNTGMDDQKLHQFIKINNYEGLKKLPNLQISEPILDQMIKKFHQYDHLQLLLSRFKSAQDKLLIADIEKETQKLEEEVAEMEEQDKFYTELPDKEGFVQMKQKYFAEKEFWENQLAHATVDLAEDPSSREALAQVQEAERELKLLKKKKNWQRMRNVQPNITKWTGKVTKAINTVQDSIGEITKPFAEMGEMSGYGQKKEKNQYEEMFSPDKVFDTKKKDSKDKKEVDFFGGF